MALKLLADECVDFRIIQNLREEGFDVISVLQDYRGIKDKEILNLAKQLNAIIITEDSDFGEWIFSHKEKTTGVIFLRYSPQRVNDISSALIRILKKYASELYSKFTVVTVNKVRIRDM